MKKMVNESLKDELIARLMSTLFKDDDPKHYDSNIKYLESLSFEDIEEMIVDYNMHGITMK